MLSEADSKDLGVENNLQTNPTDFWSFVHRKRHISIINWNQLRDSNQTEHADPQGVVNAFAKKFESAFSTNNFYNPELDNLLYNQVCFREWSCDS